MKKQYMDFVPTKSAQAESVILPQSVKYESRTEVRARINGPMLDDRPMARPTFTEKPARSAVATRSVVPSRTTVVNRADAASGAGVAGRATVTSRAVATARPATKAVTVERSTAQAKATERPRVREVSSVKFSSEKVGLGTIEDLSERFVKTDVPKRPLSQRVYPANNSEELKEIKAQKVGKPERRFGRKTTSRGEIKKSPTVKEKDTIKKTYQLPKSPFINQNKVQKRPLSKNVYQKQVEPPKETAQGPVTIITKPEKQAHAGLIVTIILTIILGAAAGTVAFLLLPK